MNDRSKIHPTPRAVADSSRVNPLDGFAALTQIVDAARELIVVCETERTKRAQIDAYGKTEIARIRAAESILASYFEQVFAERRSTFATLFVRLDSALERSDGESVNLIVRGIVDIAKASPLADLGDLSQIRAALDDPDQVWDL